MIDIRIENLAKDVIDLGKAQAPPIDLHKIADEEGIALAPGQYGLNFSGRIEYLGDVSKFIIYHPAFDISPSVGRVRFSIAHELGHYFIDEHRSALIAGASHTSVSGFICDTDFERQADAFAAALLAPMKSLDAQLNSHGFIDLQRLVGLARDWQISVTCAAIRYVEYTLEPCAVLLSQGDKVRFYLASDEASARGFTWLGRKTLAPDALALKALKDGESKTILTDEKKVPTVDWFSARPQEWEFWQECYPLGYGGQVITLLCFE